MFEVLNIGLPNDTSSRTYQFYWKLIQRLSVISYEDKKILYTCRIIFILYSNPPNVGGLGITHLRAKTKFWRGEMPQNIFR